MSRNIGTTDAILRIAIGVVIMGIGLGFRSWWGLLGLLPIATALMGWCWLYALLGIRTNPPSPAVHSGDTKAA